MTRAFTISFDFEGKTYLALASMSKKNEEEVQYCIRVYDDLLTKIIPGGSLHYSNKKPLCPGSLNHPQALRLFTRIDEAVHRHLNVAR